MTARGAAQIAAGGATQGYRARKNAAEQEADHHVGQ